MIISALPSMRRAFPGLMRLTIVCCLVAIWAVVGSTAAAQWSDDPDAPGWASSMSYRPTRAAVAVRPLDNSKLNMELAQRFAEVLRQRGITVADDAPLLLEFETLTDSDAPRNKPGALEPRREVDIGRERDLGRSDAIDARIDVLSNTRSSVVTGIRRQTITVHYTLRATLSERQGPRLWEGNIEYGEIARDEAKIYAAMASRLAEMVGTTADRRFRVD